MCWQTYRGKGYSETFVANFDQLKAAWSTGDRPLIRLDVSADVICQPCPHRRDSSCRFAASVDSRDQALLTGMGYDDGQALPLAEALAAVQPRFLDLQETVCAGCEWQPFCRATFLEEAMPPDASP